tara:strand:+ start:600 stop:1625 length:1026 start_codon:yes stop_codon:yes gene_type:complete
MGKSYLKGNANNMVKALILHGTDRHTYRLQQSLQICGIQNITVKNYRDIPRERCDIVFVDPSLPYDPTSRINSDLVCFYDCEDAPTDYEVGIAFEAMKDSIKYYCKMNWVGEDKDGIKLIGFPIASILQLPPVANVQLPEFTSQNAIPFFAGAGTFLGNHDPVKGGVYNSEEGINCLGKYEENTMYNQRIDWLLSLRKNNISYKGGLVFRGDNLSEDWQSKYFGENVIDLKTDQLDRIGFFNNLFKYRIGLNPTGHDRNSWRIYDLMAAGSILVSTDLCNQKALYMPKEIITIKDGEDLGTRLLELQPDYKELWKAHQENRNIIKDLTPDKVWSDFMEQMK